MKRTPDGVSKARQKLGQELSIWRRAVAEVKTGQPDAAKKRAFGEEQIARCEKEMRKLRRKNVGKRAFWRDLSLRGTSGQIGRLHD